MISGKDVRIENGYIIINGEKYPFISDISDILAKIQNNAGFHNSIYRGKSLGAEVTAEQYAAIDAGTFDDMFIGDYWTIDDVKYRIAHFNYWSHTGDTECTTPHVVLVPDTNFYIAKMNESNVTTGAYVGSAMYTTNLAQAKTTINNAFGSEHILSHRELMTNAVTDGNASNWSWYDSTVDLMSEVMVYGTLAWTVGGKGYEAGIDKEQLALFRLDHSRICNRTNWWLRGVNSSSGFAFVNYDGYADSGTASTSRGVRPAFAIIASEEVEATEAEEVEATEAEEVEATEAEEVEATEAKTKQK